MRPILVALCFFLAVPLASAEKGHLPPPPEENYNSMILDYIVTGAIFEDKKYSDDWTRSYTYTGKLDPTFGGVLRVTGHAQWLTYPGPAYPWTVNVEVTVGQTTRRLDYSPTTKMQRFDLAVPIGNAEEGSFSIKMSRTSDAGNRSMGASGRMRGIAVTGPAGTTSVSVTGAALEQQMAHDLLAREMGDRQALGHNQVFYNGNDQSVANGGTPPSLIVARPTNLDMIMTYHYNSGQGATPGTITLQREDGKRFGPWRATAVNKVYWVVSPQITLPPGTYRVIDSDPGSWSQNGSGQGHVLIKGRRQGS